MILDDFVVRSPRFPEILEKCKDQPGLSEPLILQYLESLNRLAAQITSDKVDEVSKLYLARDIEPAEDSGGHVPIQIRFNDIDKAMNKYEIDPSTLRKEKIDQLGLMLVIVDRKESTLDALFCVASKYGGYAFKRLQSILDDSNVIKLDVRYSRKFSTS